MKPGEKGLARPLAGCDRRVEGLLQVWPKPPAGGHVKVSPEKLFKIPMLGLKAQLRLSGSRVPGAETRSCSF